jgi:hypothetical protein
VVEVSEVVVYDPGSPGGGGPKNGTVPASGNPPTNLAKAAGEGNSTAAEKNPPPPLSGPNNPPNAGPAAGGNGSSNIRVGKGSVIEDDPVSVVTAEPPGTTAGTQNQPSTKTYTGNEGGEIFQFFETEETWETGSPLTSVVSNTAGSTGQLVTEKPPGMGIVSSLQI